MKSEIKKVNETYVCETTFGPKNEFVYISKFKSNFTGVAYQELKTTAIPKDELDVFKNQGCKNIALHLKEHGFDVDPDQLLAERRKMLEAARNKDIKGTTPEEKLQYHMDKISSLEEALKQAKAELQAEKAEILEAMKQAEAEAKELEKRRKNLMKQLG